MRTVRPLGALAVAVAAMIVLVDGAERAEVAAALVLGLQKQVESGRHPSPAVAAFVRALRDTTTVRQDTRGQKEGMAGRVTDDGFMNAKTAATMLGCSPRTVKRRIAAGRIAARRDGRRIVIERNELRRYIDQMENA